jgi:tetratricopeptide (TPR) repeat protein
MRWALALALLGQVAGQPATLEDALGIEANGDDEAALAVVDTIVVREPAWELPRLEAARLRMKLGREEDLAGLQLEIALSIAPENPRAHFLSAQLAEQLGQVREAIRSLETALVFRPDYEEARLRLGALYLQAGDSLRGEFHLRQLVRANPRLTQARVLLAQSLEEQGRTADAEAVLTALLRDEPENGWVRRRVAEFYERTGRSGKAQALLAPTAPEPAPKMRKLPKSRR